MIEAPLDNIQVLDSVDPTTDVQFSWGDVDAQGYVLNIDDGVDVVQYETDATSFEVPLGNGDYTFWVDAVYGSVVKDCSDGALNFSVEIVPPSLCPLLVSPTFGEVLIPPGLTIDVALQWNTIAGAELYRVYVTTPEDDTPALIAETADLTHTETFPHNTFRYWCVNPVSGGVETNCAPVDTGFPGYFEVALFDP